MLHIRIDPITSCWVWTGCLSIFKYGKFRLNKKTIAAHRWSYENFIGPIPKGLEIDHMCHSPDHCRGGITCPHRRCVNPEHLKISTAKDNHQRHRSASNIYCRGELVTPITHCKRGHEFTPENTRLCKTSRTCKTCHRNYIREYKRRERAILKCLKNNTPTTLRRASSSPSDPGVELAQIPIDQKLPCSSRP